jgi:hypothetical protein
MRPFSLAAYFLRILWDGLPFLVWLGIFYTAYRLAGRFLGTPMELSAPSAAFALWVVMRGLRPVRKFFNMTAYSWMERSPVTPLVELAVWELLLVNDKYWSNELPEYEGMTAFAAAYRQRSSEWQQKINRILWRAEAVGRPHIAKPAREFLRVVQAPLREDWQ